MTQQLSPAAQAVYEAAWAAYWPKDAEQPADAELIAAAALRAVTKELKYFGITEKNILAIAAELEAQ